MTGGWAGGELGLKVDSSKFAPDTRVRVKGTLQPWMNNPLFARSNMAQAGKVGVVSSCRIDGGSLKVAVRLQGEPPACLQTRAWSGRGSWSSATTSWRSFKQEKSVVMRRLARESAARRAGRAGCWALHSVVSEGTQRVQCLSSVWPARAHLQAQRLLLWRARGDAFQERRLLAETTQSQAGSIAATWAWHAFSASSSRHMRQRSSNPCNTLVSSCRVAQAALGVPPRHQQGTARRRGGRHLPAQEAGAVPAERVKRQRLG